ncbi:lipoprotein signal peptidase [Deinococcus piscis]|uniref:Lipoprotein signal peptidase n=1 Tax=Deinococcus piscis TaxID=394230 RepID=A0ABQ3KAW7_9DEIO|nr:signal peptidase II [Deinococcus piscis]GHG10876.1 lipoprotein signal peptidase [Deinococcus piscis]
MPSAAPTPARRWPLWFPLLLAALLVAADQLLKSWALANLVYQAPAVPVIPLLLDWVLTFNTGAAWSMFSGSAMPLAALRLLVGLGLLGYLLLRPQSRRLSMVLTLIAAGAIGNAIDGLTKGKVTDMIHMPLLSKITNAFGAGDFPIFNLADVYVVLGTLALLLLSLREDRPPERSAPTEPHTSTKSHG